MKIIKTFQDICKRGISTFCVMDLPVYLSRYTKESNSIVEAKLNLFSFATIQSRVSFIHIGVLLVLFWVVVRWLTQRVFKQKKILRYLVGSFLYIFLIVVYFFILSAVHLSFFHEHHCFIYNLTIFILLGFIVLNKIPWNALKHKIVLKCATYFLILIIPFVLFDKQRRLEFETIAPIYGEKTPKKFMIYLPYYGHMTGLWEPYFEFGKNYVLFLEKYHKPGYYSVIYARFGVMEKVSDQIKGEIGDESKSAIVVQANPDGSGENVVKGRYSNQSVERTWSREEFFKELTAVHEEPKEAGSK